MADESQLSEYESQLAEINLLLEESPEDESLLKLKADLVELIQLTKEEEPANEVSSSAGVSEGTAGAEDEGGVVKEDSHYGSSSNSDLVGTDGIPSNTSNTASIPEMDLPTTSSTSKMTATLDMDAMKPAASAATSTTTSATTTTTSTKQPKKKKESSNKILNSTFEIPQHLLPIPSDTEAERNRKRRAIKALKSKFRSKKKTAETEVKQRSWQDFTKKKKRKVNINNSIFATADGINAKVGVIQGSSSPTGSGTSSKRSRHTFG